jgi:predicted methyltransferase
MGARALSTLFLVGVAVACRPDPPAAPRSSSSASSDGRRASSHGGTPQDFDFELGTWRTHLRRLVHPLTGSSTWVEYDGSSVIRPVWSGRANLVELDVSGPAGHVVGLSLRLYDPEARTWSLNFASAAGGTMAVPAIGEFKDGRGEFFDHEPYDGKQIFVRSVISDITPTSYRFEQAFSENEGKTWETNWVAVDTRTTPPLSADAICSLLGSTDRTDADRKLDATRHPAELLAFFGVGPGMTVADLGGGLGYTTELLARAVGPTGKVYGQDDPGLFKSFLQKAWAARLERPINGVVLHAARSFDEPLPPEARNLDLVVNYIFYHDTVWLGADREKMNKAIFAALKPEGSYVIVDASARDGRGVNDARTFHRIEQRLVEAEVTNAGFTLTSTADFLRNPNDTRDWDSSQGDRVGTEDRFILKFARPTHVR